MGERSPILVSDTDRSQAVSRVPLLLPVTWDTVRNERAAGVRGAVPHRLHAG